MLIRTEYTVVILAPLPNRARDDAKKLLCPVKRAAGDSGEI